jgi:hypothetical protein
MCEATACKISYNVQYTRHRPLSVVCAPGFNKQKIIFISVKLFMFGLRLISWEGYDVWRNPRVILRKSTNLIVSKIRERSGGNPQLSLPSSPAGVRARF